MRIMTPGEAAVQLRVKERTVLTWARSGKLPGSRTPAGWRFTEEDLRAFLERQRPAPKALADGDPTPQEGGTPRRAQANPLDSLIADVERYLRKATKQETT